MIEFLMNNFCLLLGIGIVTCVFFFHLMLKALPGIAYNQVRLRADYIPLFYHIYVVCVILGIITILMSAIGGIAHLCYYFAQ